MAGPVVYYQLVWPDHFSTGATPMNLQSESTKGMQIMKRTNEHLHEADKQEVSCQDLNLGINRKATESQDGSHHIVGDSLFTASEGVLVKLPKLTRFKRIIQWQRERVFAAPYSLLP